MTSGFRCIQLLMLVLLVTASAQADTRPYYWHYSPVDAFTHGIGLSRPDGERAGRWQVRANLGYELASLGGALQYQRPVHPEQTRWYLATGVRLMHHFETTEQGPCSIVNCDEASGDWEGTLYTRWSRSWGLADERFRLDLGYGVQLKVRDSTRHDQWLWSLSPSVDLTLGGRLGR